MIFLRYEAIKIETQITDLLKFMSELKRKYLVMQ